MQFIPFFYLPKKGPGERGSGRTAGISRVLVVYSKSIARSLCVRDQNHMLSSEECPCRVSIIRQSIALVLHYLQQSQLSRHKKSYTFIDYQKEYRKQKNKTRQNKTKQNKTKQQIKTKQSKALSKAKQAKQNKTKLSKARQIKAR